MPQTVSVALGSRSYDIHIGAALMRDAGRLLAPHARGVTPVITDENVAEHHLETLLASLRGQAIDTVPVVLPPGEETKSFAGLEVLCRDLVRLGIGRNGLAVVLGGGVIGDLAGLAAGLVKRGIHFAQIPTTLLAQVDSSVGGKTAIDIPEGKNLVGLFHQPKIVIADTSTLSSLPRRQLLAGYAEVVKYGALGDAGFFAWLETHASTALSGGEMALEHMVAHSCRMKAAIVARDERETGERALLNFGHTFAHALEAASEYSDRLLHGEAVAIGMVLACRLSERLGYLEASGTERFVKHLKSVGLPTELTAIPGSRIDTGRIFAHMKHDKKAEQNRPKFVLLRGIGHAFVSSDVPVEAVGAVLAG